MATAVQPSPQPTARMAGALWLAVMIVSSLAVAAPTIVVPGDAVASAHNILSNELAFRLGVVGSFYVISSVTYLISPALGSILSPVVIPVAFVGEGTTTLWLLFKGINVDKWRQRADSTALGLAAA